MCRSCQEYKAFPFANATVLLVDLPGGSTHTPRTLVAGTGPAEWERNACAGVSLQRLLQDGEWGLRACSGHSHDPGPDLCPVQLLEFIL